MFGWTAVDIPLLGALPVLLALSGFFSGSETAFFGLTESERMALRRGGTLAGRAIDSMLAQPRLLLITVLLGNMTINVLYFVISSVLLMKSATGLVGEIGLALATLLLIVLFGEVMPKLLANTFRERFCLMTAPPMFTLHQLIGPLRIGLDKVIVAPLSRLSAPQHTPHQLDQDELAALLELSGQQGVIDRDEQRILHDVISLGRLKVRDVMTPRVRMKAAAVGTVRDEIIEIARETGRTKLPVYDRDHDHILGILHVKRFLLDSANKRVSRRHLSQPRFVPEIATLDQLLEHFRTTHTQLAIAVDEFGGTAGVVAIEDVAEELVGEIVGYDQARAHEPERIAPGRWRVGGGLSVHDWAETFGQRLASPRVATLGGLIFEHLGRLPQQGDEVVVGNVRLEVEHAERGHVTEAIVTLLDDSPTESETSR